jgi:hypothetical protein
MKYIALVLLLGLASCTYNDMRKIFTDHPEGYDKFMGEFDYTKEQNESAHNKFGYEFKKPIYETEDKKRLYHFGGSVYHNYDLFSKSYHINGFGQVGVDF